MFTLEGKAVETVGASGSGPGQFDAPGGVAVDAAGDLCVADFYNHRVQVLTPDGAFVRQLGETGRKGIGVGRFNYPTDVALLPDGSVMVVDAYNDRIQVFAPDGASLRRWGGPLAMHIPGGFNCPVRDYRAIRVTAVGETRSRDRSLLLSRAAAGSGRA